MSRSPGRKEERLASIDFACGMLCGAGCEDGSSTAEASADAVVLGTDRRRPQDGLSVETRHLPAVEDNSLCYGTSAKISALIMRSAPRAGAMCGSTAVTGRCCALNDGPGRAAPQDEGGDCCRRSVEGFILHELDTQKIILRHQRQA
jgi:hypothetical protein